MKASPLGLIACLCAQHCAAQLTAPVITPGGGLVASPTLVTITHANPAGTIFYTLDGGDPREHFGGVTGAARRYDFPLSINRSVVLRARVKRGAEWSELAVAGFTADQDFSQLLITELMFHPRDTDDLAEFVEFKNVGAVPLDLSGLWLSVAGLGSPSFILPERTRIAPGEFVVFINDVAAFRALHPTARIDGVYGGMMSNGDGGMVALARPNAGAVATQQVYRTNAPWPVAPDNHGYFLPEDGVGFSLVRTTLDPAADSEDARTWRASTQRFGSPGADDPPPVVLPILISELLTRTSAGLHDAIEFYNPNAVDIPIDGWWLSDERNFPFRYLIPPGTTVPAGGYLVLDETQFGSGVSFSAERDRCYLFSGDVTGELTGYSHGFEFLGSDRDVSLGRFLASDGSEHFPAQTSQTFGGANAGPRRSPVVISEILSRHSAASARYFELRNTTDTPVPLFEGSTPWAIGTLYSPFPFPGNFTIPAQGHALIVDGDPAAFRVKHSVPAEVPVFATTLFAFSLEDGVHLFRPSGMAGGLVRYVSVDEVAPREREPWPPGAAGDGVSLERMNLQGFGNDPATWRASPTQLSPGRANSGNLPPQVWAGGDRVEFIGRAGTLRGAVADDRWPGATLSSAWTQVSGPAGIQFTGATLDAVTATFPAAGQYVVRLTATDGIFTTSNEANIDVVARPFDAWRTSHFSPVELASQSFSGPGADPDRDGLSNAAEYFFATGPKVAGSSQPLTATIVNGHLQAIWQQRLDTPDIVFVPERADRLEGPWFAGEEFFEISETNSVVVKIVTLRDRLPVGGRAQRFLRLRLVLR